ncbi:hypothetical protein BS47DRAFT_88645 [Hydnum rufescens UP504]|uniref:Uncharacterized protein n=1 Tax=Hydnum rufescens UP504 TaxID=1448309 RepID=A0A9P6AQV4_9AGAM|nr:hypothetical protein BS47DRAFT_88645 [Hydnum rufescens UP504]
MCIQLPSLSRGVPLRTWTLKFEFCFDQAEIDPTNNLLVVLPRRVSCVHMHCALFCCYNLSRIYRAPGSLTDPHHSALYLRTLSDGTPHPRAASPILFPTFTLAQARNYIIRVMGPLLGILSFESSGKLEIWNWTTCQKITTLGRDGFRRTWHSFEFSSTTSFLFAVDETIQVYEIPVGSPGAHPPMPRFTCRI